MFRHLDLGCGISGAELADKLKRVAQEQGGKYREWVTKGEDVLALGSVHTVQRGGTVYPQVEVPYTSMRGRLTRSKEIILSFTQGEKGFYTDASLLGKDKHYRMVGLTVSVVSKPVDWGRVIAWIPIFGWAWVGWLNSPFLPLSNFSPEYKAQVEKDVVIPLLSRLGELLKSTPPRPSSA